MPGEHPFFSQEKKERHLATKKQVLTLSHSYTFYPCSNCLSLMTTRQKRVARDEEKEVSEGTEKRGERGRKKSEDRGKRTEKNEGRRESHTHDEEKEKVEERRKKWR